MNQASVGFHCPECVAKHHTRVVSVRGLGTFKPIVTMVLVGINVAVWVLGQIIWRPTDIINTSNGAIAKGALIANGISGTSVTNFSGSQFGIAHGEWYRIVTSGFLHAGILHLGVNMWALWILGKITEQILGRTRMGLIYMVSLFAGSFGALLVSPHQVTLGASGAIFGLMGGLLIAGKSRGVALRDSGLLGVLGFNLALTFFLSSYLSVGGHIGGVIGGGIAAFVIIDVPMRLRKLRGKSLETYAWAASLAMMVLFGFGSVVLANRAAGKVQVVVPTSMRAPTQRPVPGPVVHRTPPS